MLLRTNAPPTNRLPAVARSIMRGFRWPSRRHRPFAASPESKIFRHTAMCARCDWQREYHEGQYANDSAVAHGLGTHGDAGCCFIRIHAR